MELQHRLDLRARGAPPRDIFHRHALDIFEQESRLRHFVERSDELRAIVRHSDQLGWLGDWTGRSRAAERLGKQVQLRPVGTPFQTDAALGRECQGFCIGTLAVEACGMIVEPMDIGSILGPGCQLSPAYSQGEPAIQASAVFCVRCLPLALITMLPDAGQPLPNSPVA
ncbi:MAG: hypothetical protein QM681_13500 [Novosphingobium sp.]